MLKRTDKEFWDWIVENRSRIEGMGPQAAEMVREIARVLSSCEPNVAFECGMAKDGVFEFVLSADGIEESMPLVERLVEGAPLIDGWRIIAFRQREQGVDVKVAWLRLNSDTIKVRPHSWYPDGKLHIEMFVPGYNPFTKRLLAGAVYVLLDKSIGEYDAITRIGSIDWFPARKATHGSFRLGDFAHFLDNNRRVPTNSDSP